MTEDSCEYSSLTRIFYGHTRDMLIWGHIELLGIWSFEHDLQLN